MISVNNGDLKLIEMILSKHIFDINDTNVIINYYLLIINY